MIHGFPRLAVAIVVLMTATAAASAQQMQPPRPDRPYRGLFGGGLGQTAQSLVANASVGGAYDTGALVAREGNQTGFESTAYGFLSAGTSYSLNLRRISFGASAATAGQYIPGTFSPYVPNHSVALYSSMPLSKRTRISAAETLSIQPYTALALALQTVEQGPVQAPLLEPMLGITRDRHLTESRSVALGHELGRRSSVSLSYARYQSRTSRGADDLTTQYLSGRFTRTFWKGVGLYVGYSVTQARYGQAPAIRAQGFEGGVDFSRSRGIEITRRTRATVGGGTSAYRSLNQFGVLQRTRYYVTANAALTHEISRAWIAALNYNRSLNFIERFQEPFLTDSVSASVGGLITRRLQFQAAASAGVSKVGLFSTASGYRTYSVTSTLNTALNRFLALGFSAGRYQYSFDGTVQTPTGVPSRLGRYSARIYLSSWVPLFHGGRRPDASR